MPPIITPPPTALPEAGGEVIGSVSHLISAALQTAGLYFQNDVLGLCTPFLMSLAVFLFIIGICQVIYTFVTQHSLKGATLLLSGPILFTFCIFQTAEVSPTVVRTGSRVDNNARSEQAEMLKKISGLDIYEKKPTVSFFFSKFDRLVSSLVQSMVGFLIDTENNKDLVKVAREKVFTKVFTAGPEEIGFIKLIHTGVVGQCAELARRNEELGRLKLRIETLTAQRSPDARKFDNDVIGLEEKIALLNKVRVPLDIQEQEFLRNLYPGDEIPENMDCQNVWDYTWKTAKLKAEEVKTKATTADLERRGVPWDDVRKEIDDSVGNGNSELATQIIAAHVIKNSLKSTALSSISNDMMVQAPMSSHFYNLINRTVALTEGEGHQGSMQFFIGVIPYLQGVLLFFLTGAFPFFCLLLLLPYQMRRFLIWVSLWIWVKSWDVGFAMIHSVREILWRMMCIETVPNSNQVNWDQMTDVFRIMNQFDPLVNIGVYNLIIASLMMLVPVITAHVCMGADTFMGAFRTGIDQTAQRFRLRIANASRRSYATLVESQLGNYEQQKGLKAARKYFQNYGAMSVLGRQVSLAKSGDGAYAKGGEAVYDQETVGNRWQEQTAMDLAVMSNRGVFHRSYSSGVSQPLIEAKLTEHNMRYSSPDANQAHGRDVLRGVPGLAPARKPSDSNTGATSIGGDGEKPPLGE